MKYNLDLYDSLEVLKFENQLAEYPIHYHETYCVSLIEEGIFNENQLIAPQGSILISHPFEIHINKAIEDINVSFSTLYISQEVIDFISPYQSTSFENRIINNPILANQLNRLLQLIYMSKKERNFTTHFYSKFYQFIAKLVTTYGCDKLYKFRQPSSLLNEVKQYIERNLKAKISLSRLAENFGMNKFQFIRWFKVRVGITPFEYILLMRIGLGKRLIQQGVPIVDASLDSGFYDQSHFSNYFKKYVGLSPKNYKNSCNIFQDF